MAAWPEGGAPADAGALARTLDALLSHVDAEPARRMLWVAASVARATGDGALEATPALRQAFASVERESRRLFEDDGFGIPRAESALEPTRQLQIGRASCRQRASSWAASPTRRRRSRT